MDWPAQMVVLVCQALFLVTALVGIDQPFLSTHNERQNQTYDTARHIFHQGWSAVLTPRAGFSLPGFEAQNYTVIAMEAPFHGLLGWPFERLFGHERAMVRLVSCFFALFSIQLIYLLIRLWLPASVAAAGACLWATCPLVLHFGQVPMPDILCTAGILAAFWFALRGSLVLSSAWFLFAILAKSSVIVFGLPILVALLVHRNTTSARVLIQTTIFWGAAPLLGLVGWTLLVQTFSPTTPWTLWRIFFERGDTHLLLKPSFYALILACLTIAGVGVVGVLAFLAAFGKPSSLNHKVKWALIVSNLLYLAIIVQKIPEPQYFLPTIAWTVIAVSFGFDPLLSWFKQNSLRRVLLATTLFVQVVSIVLVTCELKSPRVKGFDEINSVARMLPPKARVIAAYPFYGGSAAVWLNHNVIAVHSPGELREQLPKLQQLGFTHVVILDVDHRYDFRSLAKAVLFARQRLEGIWQKPALPVQPAEAVPSSNMRRYCDEKFTRLFAGRYVALYSLPTAAIGAPAR